MCKEDNKIFYFGHGMDANRYAKARPYIHPTALEKFRSFAHIDAPLSRALDVGCGTGQSTVALTEIAESVIGIDPSEDMLAHAEPHPSIEYRQSTAEDILLPDEEFQLITVGQAFHWFDHSAFLAEANRLLRPPGWLVIYTSWFTSEMKENSSFADWFKGSYLSRYPTPPRNRTEITAEFAQKHGFAFRGEDEFSDRVSMTIEKFADYQLSTTNIIAAVKRGNERFEDASRWITTSIAKFFADEPQRTFLFWGKIWYLQKKSK
jgi:ubiquinone/menaquinone biosynthesis C-methylase UbiE